MRGNRALSVRASDPAARGPGWEAASLQVMAHIGSTRGAASMSMANSREMVRSGAPSPWSAAMRAASNGAVDAGTLSANSVAVSRSPTVTG